MSTTKLQKKYSFFVILKVSELRYDRLTQVSEFVSLSSQNYLIFYTKNLKTDQNRIGLLELKSAQVSLSKLPDYIEDTSTPPLTTKHTLKIRLTPSWSPTNLLMITGKSSTATDSSNLKTLKITVTGIMITPSNPSQHLQFIKYTTTGNKLFFESNFYRQNLVIDFAFQIISTSLDASNEIDSLTLDVNGPYVSSKSGSILSHDSQRMIILKIFGQSSTFTTNFDHSSPNHKTEFQNLGVKCKIPQASYQKIYYPGVTPLSANSIKNGNLIKLMTPTFKQSYYVMGMEEGTKGLQTACLGESGLAQMLFKDLKTGKTYLDSYNLRGTRPEESELDFRHFRYSRMEVMAGAVSFTSRTYQTVGAIFTAVKNKGSEKKGITWEVYRTELNQMSLRIETSSMEVGKTYDLNLGVSDFYNAGKFAEESLKVEVLEKMKKIELELPPILSQNPKSYLSEGPDRLIRCGHEFDLDRFLGVQGMRVGLNFTSKTADGPKEGVDFIFKGRKHTINHLNNSFLDEIEHLEDDITDDDLAPFIANSDPQLTSTQPFYKFYLKRGGLKGLNLQKKQQEFERNQQVGGLSQLNSKSRQPASGELLISDLKIEGKWMLLSYETNNTKKLSMVYHPVNFTSEDYSKFTRTFTESSLVASYFSIGFIKVSQNPWKTDYFQDPEVFLTVVYNGTAYKKPDLRRKGKFVTTRNSQLMLIYSLKRSNKNSYLKRVFKKTLSKSDFVLSQDKTWVTTVGPGTHFIGMRHASKNIYRFMYLEDPSEAEKIAPSTLQQLEGEGKEREAVENDDFDIGDKYLSDLRTKTKHNLKTAKVEDQGTKKLTLSTSVDFTPNANYDDYQFIKAAYIDQKSGNLRYRELLIYANFTQGVLGVTWINRTKTIKNSKNGPKTSREANTAQALILKSATFAISKEHIGRTNHFDCSHPKIFNISSNHYKNGDSDLTPNHLYISCYFSIVGSFDYIIDYELSLDPATTQNFTNVFVSSKIKTKVVTPDGFVMDEVTRLLGAIVVKMKNLDEEIRIDPKHPKSCPQIVVVYKLSEGSYPWVIYSCKDFNISDSGVNPLYASYHYDHYYLWVTKSRIKIGGTQLPKSKAKLIQRRTDTTKNQKYFKFGGNNSEISQRRDSGRNELGDSNDVIESAIKVISVHQMKNSTLELLKSLPFEKMQLTLRSLNSHKILANLGLLTSITETNYKIEFEGGRPAFFFLIFLVMLGIVYTLYKDLNRTKSFSYMFKGATNTNDLEYDWSFMTIDSEGNKDMVRRATQNGMILLDSDDEDLADLNEIEEDFGDGDDSIILVGSGSSEDGDPINSSADWEEDDVDDIEEDRSSWDEEKSLGEAVHLPTYNFDETGEP